MIVGYARTSTADQVAGLEDQTAKLTAHGCERIFSEHISSVAARPELESALSFVRSGDSFVVTSISRLARSVADVLAIQKRLAAKGASLRILDLNLDTSQPTGALILNVLSSISQFERELLLERQKIGIAKAKSEGLYKGRTPTAKVKSHQVLKLRTNGERPTFIAKNLGISIASVYRILATAKPRSTQDESGVSPSV